VSLDPTSQVTLIADLNSTYPGIDAAPLAATSPAWLVKGIRINGAALMPDGLPLLSGRCPNQEEYDGAQHAALDAWLELRGWYASPGDRGDVVLLPIPAVAIAIERLTGAWYPRPCARQLMPGEVPF
jgi:hypothetical protein